MIAVKIITDTIDQNSLQGWINAELRKLREIISIPLKIIDIKIIDSRDIEDTGLYRYQVMIIYEDGAVNYFI